MKPSEIPYDVEPSCQVGNLSSLYMQYFGYRIGSFVEVGAYDGKSWSATSCLAKAGWRGLMIEPIPAFAERCRKNHANNPNVEVIESCCGEYDGTVTIFCNTALSTTSRQMIADYKQVAWARASTARPIKVAMARLSTLLKDRNWPSLFDVLVVDTEGTELDVLKGLDWSRWRPTMAIIECCEKHKDTILASRAPAINDWMEHQGYAKVQSGTIDSVFVLRK